jgi:hypothetical protein
MNSNTQLQPKRRWLALSLSNVTPDPRQPNQPTPVPDYEPAHDPVEPRPTHDPEPFPDYRDPPPFLPSDVG